MRKITISVLALLAVLGMTACSLINIEVHNPPSENVENNSETKITSEAKEDIVVDMEEKEDTAEELQREELPKEEVKTDESKDNNMDNDSDKEALSQSAQGGSSEEALLFAANLKAGWNLGNTLDACNAGQNNQVNSEVCWGNPKTTKEMIAAVKNAGYTTIRIPVSWHNHITLTEDNRMLIDDSWLKRVKEVVGYAIDNDMYVIINIHHDNEPEGKRGYIPDYENEEQALWYVGEVWSQVAPYFNEFDNHLIFEGLNEPRLTNDDANEWWLDENSDHCKEAVDVINKLNQKFVDTVRATGGYNAERYLMVPGYCASMQGAVTKGFAVPNDSASNRIMISLHAYIPYSFALNEDTSLATFDPDDVNSTYDIDHTIKKMKEKFIDKGIPVVIGEFGARDKNGNVDERIKYYNYFTLKCSENGIPCCVWDNGVFSGNGERFGLLDREKCEFVDKDIVNAMVLNF